MRKSYICVLFYLHQMKIALLIICAGFIFGAQAQKKKPKDNPTWFNLEIKGGGGTSLFTNHNISGDKQINMYNFGFYPVFGVGFGSHITNSLAVQIEKNWNTLGQKYTYKNGLPDKTYKLKTSDLGIFVRGTGDGGGYVGVGFKMSNVSNSSISDSTFFFRRKLNFVHFELGGPLWQNNMFDVNLNIRFGYCINDMVNNKLFEPGAYTVYPSHAGTYPLTLQAMIGFNWHIGYFATSNCKHKGFLLFTN